MEIILRQCQEKCSAGKWGWKSNELWHSPQITLNKLLPKNNSDRRPRTPLSFEMKKLDSVELAEIGSNEKVTVREFRDDKQNTRTLAKFTRQKIKQPRSRLEVGKPSWIIHFEWSSHRRPNSLKALKCFALLDNLFSARLLLENQFEKSKRMGGNCFQEI